MSKSALDQFTRCVAMELAEKGVRCNSINPGVIDTNFHDCLGFEKGTPQHDAIMEAYAKMHPIGRYGESEECVNAITFLANDKAGFITGKCFNNILTIKKSSFTILCFKLMCISSGITLPIDGGLNAKSPR